VSHTIDFDEPLESMKKALLAAMPVQSPVEMAAAAAKFDTVCDRVLRRLNHRLRGINDPIVINEELVQAKLIMYDSWVEGMSFFISHSPTVISDVSQSSGRRQRSAIPKSPKA